MFTHRKENEGKENSVSKYHPVLCFLGLGEMGKAE